MAKQPTTPSAVENTPAIESTEAIIETPVTIQAPTEPALINGFNFAQMVEDSANLGALKPVLTLTAEYIELEKPSEFFDGIFIGKQEMNVTDKQSGELKTITACRFLVDKKVKINAGAVLVSEIDRAAIQVGTAIRVTYTAKNGNTKLYEIALLG